MCVCVCVCVHACDTVCSCCTTVSIPTSLHTAQGEEIEYAVVIKSKTRGHFSTDLCCRLENCDKAVSLHVSGQVEVCTCNDV